VSRALPLFPVNRRHLDVLTTDVGIMQHAQEARPDPSHGYCTDDVARALLVDLLHQRELGWEAVETSVARNVTFMGEAFEASTGRFRNLRRADGTWLDVPGSEDADARALRSLAEVIASAPAGSVLADATVLFERALSTASRVHFLRPLAGVILACDAAVRAGLVGDVMDVYRRVASELWRSFGDREVDTAWPWPENVITYENELPAQALLVAGHRLDRPNMIQAGLRVLDWLIEAQTNADGHLSSVGNAGWWPRGGVAARYDQQPISATTLLLAAETAFEETGAPRYEDAVESAYSWFLGRNDAHTPVAEPATGACNDGIGPAGVSRNQGAESTLMWLIALEHVRGLRARTLRTDRMPSDALAAVS
jgi:hypothetical protein